MSLATASRISRMETRMVPRQSTVSRHPKKVYLIGSLRNPAVPSIGATLRREGFDVFDDWFAAGPEADDKWREYEEARGRTYIEALQGKAATNVFCFDERNLNECNTAVLVLPAGKSGHMELGRCIGQGKPTYILLPPATDRWDVMYRFATAVCPSIEDLLGHLGLTV